MDTPKERPVPKPSISQISDTHTNEWVLIKDKISEQLLSFHMSKIFEVKDPTIMGAELTQLVADIATEQNIDELPIQYKTARIKRSGIESLVNQEYEDVIQRLTDDQKKVLVDAILDVLKTSVGTEKYIIEILQREKKHDYDFIFKNLGLEIITANDLKADAAVLFLKEYIKKLHGRLKDMQEKGTLSQDVDLNKKFDQSQIQQIQIDEKLSSDNGAAVNFTNKLAKLTSLTEKLSNSPSYDELLAIQDSLDGLVAELNVGNTDPNKTGYKEIFKRDRSLLPVLIVTAIKFLFVTLALGLAIAGIFVPVLLIPAAILVVFAAATAIFQKKIMEKRGEQPALKPSEGLDQAVPETELTNSIPGWSAIKSLFFDYFIPTFTDVFKYSYLLSKSAAHPAIEIGNYVANARTVRGYISIKMYDRSGTGEGKPRASAAADNNRMNSIPELKPVSEQPSTTVGYDRMDSALELRSVSERPSTQGSQLRPDSQQSWRSDSSFGHEPDPSPSVNKAQTRNEYTRNLQNLRKTKPVAKPEESSPPSRLPRPSSKPWPSGSGKK